MTSVPRVHAEGEAPQQREQPSPASRTGRQEETGPWRVLWGQGQWAPRLGTQCPAWETRPGSTSLLLPGRTWADIWGLLAPQPQGRMGL